MNATRCRSCSFPFEKGDRFCPECGTELVIPAPDIATSVQDTSTSKGRTGRPLLIGLAAGISVAIIVLAVMLLLQTYQVNQVTKVLPDDTPAIAEQQTTANEDPPGVGDQRTTPNNGPSEFAEQKPPNSPSENQPNVVEKEIQVNEPVDEQSLDDPPPENQNDWEPRELEQSPEAINDPVEQSTPPVAPPQLIWIPRDAAFFLHVKPNELWSSETFKLLGVRLDRDQLMVQSFPPEEISQMTQVGLMDDDQNFQLLNFLTHDKDDKQLRDQMLASHPCKQVHDGKTYYTSESDPVAVHFVDAQSVVYGDSSLLRRYLSSANGPKTDDEWTPAFELTEEDVHVVFGFRPFPGWKLGLPFKMGKAELVVLGLNLDREARIKAQVTFANSNAAKAFEKSARELLSAGLHQSDGHLTSWAKRLALQTNKLKLYEQFDAALKQNVSIEVNDTVAQIEMRLSSELASRIDMLLPTRYQEEASITVNAAASTVFPLINSPQMWRDWNLSEPNVNVSRPPGRPTEGVGSAARFDSQSADGRQRYKVTITASDAKKSVQYSSSVITEYSSLQPMGTSFGTINLVETEKGTEIFWSTEHELHDPLFRFIMFANPSSIREQMDLALERLKKLVEASDQVDSTDQEFQDTDSRRVERKIRLILKGTKPYDEKTKPKTGSGNPQDPSKVRVFPPGPVK